MSKTFRKEKTFTKKKKKTRSKKRVTRDCTNIESFKHKPKWENLNV